MTPGRQRAEDLLKIAIIKKQIAEYRGVLAEMDQDASPLLEQKIKQLEDQLKSLGGK